MPSPSIRPATTDDAPAIQAIYAHHVLYGLASFDEEPPDIDYIAHRIDEVTSQGMPWLALEEADVVKGYAYATQLRPRAAYRFTVEDSVYIAPDAMGRGFGRALLTTLISACEANGLRQMIAAIGDSANEPSIGLHRACGFARVGLYSQVGFKHGRWLDVVLMQRGLNPAQPAGS